MAAIVNTGEFWELHPDVWPGVKTYVDADPKGNIIEYWERDENGVMIDRTDYAQARLELARAQENYDNFMDKEDFDDEHYD